MRSFILVLLIARFASAGFTDVTLEANVDYLQWNGPPLGVDENSRQTGGAAAGDVNGDGYPDLFVTRFDAPDILFLNDQQGGFTNASVAGGFRSTWPSNGAALGDLDNDGDLDLYVTSGADRRHYLYVNDGQGRFTEEGRQRGAAIMTNHNRLGTSTAMGDYNRDGYLDLHVLEWGNARYDLFTLYSHARVLKNQGAANPGHFVDTTVESGVFLDDYVGFSSQGSREGVYAFTSTFADFDVDGHLDVAVVGDFHTSRLFWGNGDNATFTAAHGPFDPKPSGIGTDENGMGSAVGDINGDGLLDWFVTSIYDANETCLAGDCVWNTSGNRLYVNNGDRTFSDGTDAAGVRDGGWGWGAVMFDYDNDGDLDVAMTNGMVQDEPEIRPFFEDPMKLWQNDGTGKFTEVAAAEGLTDTAAGKGILTFDYDLDGDLDLFVVNNADHPKLYRNDNDNGNSFLKVTTEGTQSNRDGIGAFLTLLPDPDAAPIIRYITGGGTNFLSQSDMTVHFGLGQRNAPIHQLVIDWPSGTRQTFSNVTINHTLHAVEPIPVDACDVNEDGSCDATDIDAMTQMVLDGSKTLGDRAALIESPEPDGFNTYIGDSDLNGSFDEQDIVAAFISGKYLSGQSAGWAEGDWDGDFLFSEQDFVSAFIAGGYLQSPRGAVSSVPEPSGLVLLLIGLLGLARRRR